MVLTNRNQSSVGSFEKSIAKLYIFFLTLRMISPFAFTQTIFHAAATDFDFILHIIGIVLILIRNRGVVYFDYDNETFLLKFFGKIVLFLNFSSLVMACFMQEIYGSIGNHTAFSAVIGMIIYWFQYFFIFYYNKEIFAFLTKRELESVIQAEIWALLVLGYIQIGVINNGALGRIYDKLDIFSVLKDASMQKLALTGTEGAAGGTIIGIFVIPFLASGIFSKENHLGEIIQIFLWLPVLLYARSSTAYLVTLAIIPMMIIIGAYGGKISKKGVLGLVIILVVVLLLFINRTVILSHLPQEISSELTYLIFEKATDKGNGSTAARMIPLITNWGAFKEYPIFGVGNGCQGYFYLKYFPAWAMNRAGSDIMTFYHRAQEDIVNGAVFFPSILSGYGIVGTLFVLNYIIKSHQVMRSKVDLIGRFKYFYYLACLPIVLAGFQGEFAGEYYIWFVLSIPYMCPETLEDYYEEW